MDPLLSAFDRQFALIDRRTRELLSRIDETHLFCRPRALTGSVTPFSCGEYILRSTAMVERAFGGITTRLWDDPFEWTLPEELSTKKAITQYLDEVDETRKQGQAFLRSDEELKKRVPAPEQLRSIQDILLESIMAASHYQGRAFAVFQMLLDDKLPRL
jgi:hypothetical protein